MYKKSRGIAQSITLAINLVLMTYLKNKTNLCLDQKNDYDISKRKLSFSTLQNVYNTGQNIYECF